MEKVVSHQTWIYWHGFDGLCEALRFLADKIMELPEGDRERVSEVSVSVDYDESDGTWSVSYLDPDYTVEKQ